MKIWKFWQNFWIIQKHFQISSTSVFLISSPRNSAFKHLHSSSTTNFLKLLSQLFDSQIKPKFLDFDFTKLLNLKILEKDPYSLKYIHEIDFQLFRIQEFDEKSPVFRNSILLQILRNFKRQILIFPKNRNYIRNFYFFTKTTNFKKNISIFIFKWRFYQKTVFSFLQQKTFFFNIGKLFPLFSIFCLLMKSRILSIF